MKIKYTGTTSLREYGIHLKNLSPEDKFTRFCHTIKDEQIDKLILSMLYAPEFHHLFVATEDDQVIGFAHLAQETDESWELSLSVDASAQSKGVGNQLMSYAIEWAKMNKVQRLYMHCISSNKKIQHLARKHDLKTIDRSGGDITSEVNIPIPSISDHVVAYFRTRRELLNNISTLQLKLFEIH